MSRLRDYAVLVASPARCTRGVGRRLAKGKCILYTLSPLRSSFGVVGSAQHEVTRSFLLIGCDQGQRRVGWTFPGRRHGAQEAPQTTTSLQYASWRSVVRGGEGVSCQ